MFLNSQSQQREPSLNIFALFFCFRTNRNKWKDQSSSHQNRPAINVVIIGFPGAAFRLFVYDSTKNNHMVVFFRRNYTTVRGKQVSVFDNWWTCVNLFCTVGENRVTCRPRILWSRHKYFINWFIITNSELSVPSDASGEIACPQAVRVIFGSALYLLFWCDNLQTMPNFLQKFTVDGECVYICCDILSPKGLRHPLFVQLWRCYKVTPRL